jgi:hypothetical protein
MIEGLLSCTDAKYALENGTIGPCCVSGLKIKVIPFFAGQKILITENVRTPIPAPTKRTKLISIDNCGYITNNAVSGTTKMVATHDTLVTCGKLKVIFFTD